MFNKRLKATTSLVETRQNMTKLEKSNFKVENLVRTKIFNKNRLLVMFNNCHVN